MLLFLEIFSLLYLRLVLRHYSGLISWVTLGISEVVELSLDGLVSLFNRILAFGLLSVSHNLLVILRVRDGFFGNVKGGDIEASEHGVVLVVSHHSWCLILWLACLWVSILSLVIGVELIPRLLLKLAEFV